MAAVENTCVLGREKIALRVMRILPLAFSPFWSFRRKCSGSNYTQKECDWSKGRARTWCPSGILYLIVGLRVCGPVGSFLI